VVDQATAEVADDNAVLVTTDTTGDSLFVHDVVANLRSVNDLTVEVGALVEYPAEVRTKIRMAPRENTALRIFDHAVHREAGDEALEVTLVVGQDVLIDRIAHGWAGCSRAAISVPAPSRNPLLDAAIARRGEGRRNDLPLRKRTAPWSGYGPRCAKRHAKAGLSGDMGLRPGRERRESLRQGVQSLSPFPRGVPDAPARMPQSPLPLEGS
jgi:hypothetical protein